MKVIIKQPKPKDWKVLQKLNNQVFLNDKENDKYLDLDWPFSKAGIKYYKDLANGDYGHSFIAYLENEPVGYIVLAEKKFGYRKGKHIEVENMGVNPKYRSQGVGKLLMDHAAKWAKSVGAKTMYVEAYWKNKGAINFYQKIGFEEMGLELERKV